MGGHLISIIYLQLCFLKALKKLRIRAHLLYSLKKMLSPSDPQDRGSYSDQFKQRKLVGEVLKIKCQSHIHANSFCGGNVGRGGV